METWQIIAFFLSAVASIITIVAAILGVVKYFSNKYKEIVKEIGILKKMFESQSDKANELDKKIIDLEIRLKQRIIEGEKEAIQREINRVQKSKD